ncbi:MAG: CHAT domain-containing protein [Chloroflexi bacterium]|nr:CHAT domain-containing protein [Chloroflexota bacterium]
MFALPPGHRFTREQFSVEPSSLPVATDRQQKYRRHYQLGNYFKRADELASAQAEYQKAIQALEDRRAQLLIEQRTDFLADKQFVYEDMVDLCLDLQQPDQALAYAELVKSRALADLLAIQVDLSADGQHYGEPPWGAALRHLRQARDQGAEAWHAPDEVHLRGGALSRTLVSPKPHPSALALIVAEAEQRLVTLWGSVRPHNRSVGQPPLPSTRANEAIQVCLAPDTALVEYFVIKGHFVAFVMTAERISAQRLPSTLPQVQQLLLFLQLNLKAVAHSTPTQLAHLTRNANQLLLQLYKLLFAPLHGSLAAYPRLIIVPHGLLHQLPFSALYDGQAYLIEQHEISYLPRASLLPYCTQTARRTEASKTMNMVALGYSVGGRLPYAVQEAQQVARRMQGVAFVEEAATTAQIRQVAGECRLLHVATHGHFRIDNPLFSGLALADGWLTLLDILNLRLPASLVTLSACQTGCHLVASGDELLGLMRAFLISGTSSLVTCLWAVQDQATQQFMDQFYQKLADGWTKGAALQAAQLHLLHSPGGSGDGRRVSYAHPYFWAPFFLVGASGAL